MERNKEIDVTQRKFTSRLIVERALERGWEVIGFASNAAIFLMKAPDMDHYAKVFSASPPQMSYPAAKIAKDKSVTNKILSLTNIPVPDEVLLDLRSKKMPLEEAKAFLAKHGKIVIKPLDASHGMGITVDITSNAQVETALLEAKGPSTRNLVIAQQQVAGIDVRIVCIGYKFVDAITRIPASVIGDGEHTTEELIVLTNQSPERGENYKARLNYIPVDKVTCYLGKARMNDVPAKDETVQVIGVSNIGMGGVRQNVKNEIPEFLIKLAEDAAKSLELPVCGVDFMLKQLPVKDCTYEELDPYIIEVNECPMLTMYEDLYSPEQTAVIDVYLDYVATA